MSPLNVDYKNIVFILQTFFLSLILITYIIFQANNNNYTRMWMSKKILMCEQETIRNVIRKDAHKKVIIFWFVEWSLNDEIRKVYRVVDDIKRAMGK